MKGISLNHFLIAILITGIIATVGGCKKRDLTAPIFKHTQWRYMKCLPKYATDSTIRLAGPLYDTLTGTTQTAILRVDNRQISFRDLPFFLSNENEYKAIYDNSNFYGDGRTGFLEYYRAADSVYSMFSYPDAMYSANGSLVHEYWWTID